MIKSSVFTLSLIFSMPVYADVCSDLRIELAEAINKVPSPGGQLFVAFPDGKTCSASVG